MFSKVAKIISNAVRTLIDLFQNSTKVNNFLGYFWERICCQELSKIEQSGHTAGPITTPKIYLVLAKLSVPWDKPIANDSIPPKMSQLDLPGHLNSAVVGDLRPHVHYKARILAENSLGRGEPSHGITVIFLLLCLTYFELRSFVRLEPSITVIFLWCTILQTFSLNVLFCWISLFLFDIITFAFAGDDEFLWDVLLDW